MSKDQESVHQAFTELAPRYESAVDQELRTFWGWSYQDFIDHLLQRTRLEAGQRVLDIATGTSVIPRKLAAAGHTENQLIGLDITEAMLRRGKTKIEAQPGTSNIHLTCGDAMHLPYPEDAFDLIVTGLASHHMDIDRLLEEIRRVLKTGGTFSMIDVGSSPFWRLPLISGFSRIFAFFYFLLTENISRAWAEAEAVSNVLSPQEWQRRLTNLGFAHIDAETLPSKFSWLPEPLAISAQLVSKER